MSLARPSRRQATRTSSKKSKSTKSSPRKAKVVDASQASTHSAKDFLPDSGFSESLGDDFSLRVDRDLPSHAFNHADWELYADENLARGDDDCFNEDDATDIASVKANHGSNYNGQNNEDHTLVSQRSLPAQGGQALHVIYESPRRNDPPHHVFSHHPTTQASTTPLQTWIRTPEQHEIIAYSFEHPPHCPCGYHGTRPSWVEDIDLSPYEVQH